jgi:SsrA-binding protein
MLEGSEIKSLITGQVNINQSYITIHDNRVVIKNMYIKNIQNNAFSHTETRDRVLLLTKQQIKKWEKELKVRGTSIMCLSLFYDGKRFKMEIGIGTGKKNYDKRETIKQRDISRENN